MRPCPWRGPLVACFALEHLRIAPATASWPTRSFCGSLKCRGRFLARTSTSPSPRCSPQPCSCHIFSLTRTPFPSGPGGEVPRRPRNCLRLTFLLRSEPTEKHPIQSMISCSRLTNSARMPPSDTSGNYAAQVSATDKWFYRAGLADRAAGAAPMWECMANWLGRAVCGPGGFGSEYRDGCESAPRARRRLSWSSPPASQGKANSPFRLQSDAFTMSNHD